MCTENIKWLRGFVANHYDIFKDFKVQYLANKKLNTLIKLGKRKADEIDKELATNFESDSGNLIKAELPLTFEGLNIDNRTTQAITLQLEETKLELKNTKKKLRESSIMIDQLHEQLDRTSSTNSTIDPESVSDIIDQLINKGKLGSLVLVSTNIYLELVLNQSYPICGNNEITSRKYTIKVIGLNIHITVIYSNCETQMNYNNKTNDIDFRKQ
ncbi:14814_t:CDS:2 [Racocetra fulgida]|uniref:14814_t:CDS:1 n=1 Tax=Racocetra fulgida TaxID=60492 RepID=A0A9N8VZT7_9GLOM|nr:14814_t:CDS:2 [Racocetra fulgida]